jgi:pentatricopeptide repeat protein
MFVLIQVDRALEVYKTMRANRIQGTPECYTAAVHACSQKGDLDAALSLYDDLKKDGVQPDEVGSLSRSHFPFLTIMYRTSTEC